MSAIKELFTKVKASLSSLLKYTPSKAPISDFHTPSQDNENILPLPEDQPPNTGYDTASFYMAKKDSKFYNTTSNYPTTQLKYETTDKKLTRSEYKNLNVYENNFSFLKKRKINSVLKMVQYITNDKFNNNCDESLNISENVSMRTNNSAFKNIGGFKGGILNEKRKILNFNDFSSNSMLMKKNPLNPSSSSKIHDDSISMNSYYSSNSYTKKMLNKSLILNRKSLNELSLEIQRKKKDNEETIKKISENSLIKKVNTEYEERKKILENYYKKKESLKSQQKNVSIYNFFNNNDNSCFDNLHFIHNEKIMLKGIEKPKESLKINKNNQITISGTETKKDNHSIEKKKENLFTFKNLDNKDEEKKESIFLYGKKEEKEIKESRSTSLFGSNFNKDSTKLQFAVDNKKEEDKSEKKNLFGFTQENKGSLFDKSNNIQEKKPSLFGELTKESKETKGLFGFISPNESKKEEKKEVEPKKEEKKDSVFENTTKPIFMVPKEKTVELKTTPFSESILKNPVFGVPKEKTDLFAKQKETENKTNSIFNTQTQKEEKPKGSLFGNVIDEKPTNSIFSNLNNKPKEENKDNKKDTPLFGDETIKKANNLFGNIASNEVKKEEVKPTIKLNKINDEKEENKSKETVSNSIFNPTPNNEKKDEEKKNSLFGVATTSGSLFNSSNPFIARVTTQNKINNIFSLSSTLSNQPTAQTEQPKPQNLSLFGSSLSSTPNLFGTVQNQPTSTNQPNNQDDMQLSPIGSPRKLENPSTMNIFGNTTQGMNEQKSIFTQNTNSLFNSNISTTQNLFGNNTVNSNNTLFPQIQNQTSLGVPQASLFSSSNFSIGKPTFSMGRKK